MEFDVTYRFLEAYSQLKKLKKVKNQRDFCDKISMPTSTFTEISKGRSGVGIKNVLKLVHTFNIDANWLFYHEDVSEDLTSLAAEPKQNYESMNCENCPYYQDMKRYHEDTLRYRKEIDYLNQQLSELRDQDQPKSKRHSA